RRAGYWCGLESRFVQYTWAVSRTTEGSSAKTEKRMAPPGIEPGLTQIKSTTMCRHTTRPWHLLDEKLSYS
ncbi:hypothetical protein N7516_003743, partial [Penicillium verrucosum]|uniref:uncharacterized protein n=1 Tax=Penicillium verrucosum TaxID=60171 RepID=UPI002545B5BB